MIDNNLVGYIKQNLGKGYSVSSIQTDLTNQGYSTKNISDTINYVQGNSQESSSTGRSKTPPFILLAIVLILVIGSIFLFMNFSSKSISEDEFSQGTNFNLKENNVDECNNEVCILVNTGKTNYMVNEPFAIDLNIISTVDPFEAVIIYEFKKKGFSNKYYSGYIETLDGSNLNKSKFHAGYRYNKAFRIYDHQYGSEQFTSQLNTFIDEGVYTISVFVYSCADLLAKEYECTRNRVFPSIFKDELSSRAKIPKIVKEIAPLAEASKEIAVQGGETLIECNAESDCTQTSINTVSGKYLCFDRTPIPFCVECDHDSVCKEGLVCQNYKCLPIECEDNSDCIEECENCFDGTQGCVDGICVNCDVFDYKCSEGYDCKQWGCTSKDILRNLNDCTYEEGCGFSDRTKDPVMECSGGVISKDDYKCVECFKDMACLDGYHCYNYQCVAD